MHLAFDFATLVMLNVHKISQVKRADLRRCGRGRSQLHSWPTKAAPLIPFKCVCSPMKWALFRLPQTPDRFCGPSLRWSEKWNAMFQRVKNTFLLAFSFYKSPCKIQRVNSDEQMRVSPNSQSSTGQWHRTMKPGQERPTLLNHSLYYSHGIPDVHITYSKVGMERVPPIEPAPDESKTSCWNNHVPKVCSSGKQILQKKQNNEIKKMSSRDCPWVKMTSPGGSGMSTKRGDREEVMKTTLAGKNELGRASWDVKCSMGKKTVLQKFYWTCWEKMEMTVRLSHKSFPSPISGLLCPVNYLLEDLPYFCCNKL